MVASCDRLSNTPEVYNNVTSALDETLRSAIHFLPPSAPFPSLVVDFRSTPEVASSLSGMGGLHVAETGRRGGGGGGGRRDQTMDLSVLQLLLAFLYLAIVCDLIYVFSTRYISTWIAKPEKPAETHRVTNRGCYRLGPSTGIAGDISKRRKDMTLNTIWNRILSEARDIQRINTQNAHCQAMRDAKGKARGSDRDKSSMSRGKSRKMSLDDQKIDMVRWAARISLEHDPKS